MESLSGDGGIQVACLLAHKVSRGDQEQGVTLGPRTHCKPERRALTFLFHLATCEAVTEAQQITAEERSCWMLESGHS